MRRFALIAAFAALLAAGCGGNGSNTYGGSSSDNAAAVFGECALCHPVVANNMLPTGKSLLCQSCHTDARPGYTGPGHMTIPGPELVPSFVGPSHALRATLPLGYCAYCHNSTAQDLVPYSSSLVCTNCHNEAIPNYYGPGHDTLPTTQQVPSPSTPPHVLGPQATFGVCAFCHNNNATSMLTTAGDLRCPQCHADQSPGVYGPNHRALPTRQQAPSPSTPAHQLGAQAIFGNCAYCHNTNATSMTATAGDLRCPQCHADQEPGQYGPDHRALPTQQQAPSPSTPAHQLGAQSIFGNCAYCHNTNATSMTSTAGDLRCPQCHADQKPDQYGPDHRALPTRQQAPSPSTPPHQLGAQSIFGNCAYCHNTNATSMTSTAGDLRCPQCHTDQEPGQYGPDHRALPTRQQAPSPSTPAHQLGAQAIFGNCAYCHNTNATSMTSTAGSLRCPQCHTDQEPGEYGPDHRALPTTEQAPSPSTPAHVLGDVKVFGNCGYCHNTVSLNVEPYATDLQCATCHQPISDDQYGPGHQSLPGPQLVPAFPGPSHALGVQAFYDYCAYCHDNLAVNMTESRVAVSCQYCHYEALGPFFGPGHRNIPGPATVPSFTGPTHALGPERQLGNCGFCHHDTTTTAYTSTGHGPVSMVCDEACHKELGPPDDYGPGHQTRPACKDCHTDQQTHADPAAGTVNECTVCHTPHGSLNIFLIRPEIHTTSGALRAMTFTNVQGLAPGSFAQPNPPGTGLCEVCHTRTRYYNASGTGQPHYTTTCTVCHVHVQGFTFGG